jgi:hypothetical protein
MHTIYDPSKSVVNPFNRVKYQSYIIHYSTKIKVLQFGHMTKTDNATQGKFTNKQRIKEQH